MLGVDSQESEELLEPYYDIMGSTSRNPTTKTQKYPLWLGRGRAREIPSGHLLNRGSGFREKDWRKGIAMTPAWPLPSHLRR